MLKLSKVEDVMKASVEMKGIIMAIHRAITNENLVELRVEDLPKMKLDLQLKTKIKDVKIDEDSKNLYIISDGLEFMFEYENYGEGSKSITHEKFYFESEGASLTLTIME